MRPIQTRFPYGSGILNLATERNSQDHSPKGTPSPRRALTACKHTISGSISLPSRGSFHLFHHGTIRYRLIRVFSLTRYGPRRSHRIPRVPCYSGEPRAYFNLPVQDYHLLWLSFPAYSVSVLLIHTEFLVFRATRESFTIVTNYLYRTITFYGQAFQLVLIL